jgi:hypothetical protein
MASFNLNNIFPKPAIYRGSSVADQRLTVSSSAVQLFLNTGVLLIGGTTDKILTSTGDSLKWVAPYPGP